jgi:hypothetical protein
MHMMGHIAVRLFGHQGWCLDAMEGCAGRPDDTGLRVRLANNLQIGLAAHDNPQQLHFEVSACRALFSVNLETQKSREAITGGQQQ